LPKVARASSVAFVLNAEIQTCDQRLPTSSQKLLIPISQWNQGGSSQYV